MDDKFFCRFVETIDTALERDDSERFLAYVAFTPHLCRDIHGPFRYRECEGQPERVLICHKTGVLNAGAMCLLRDEYANRIAPYLLDVYAVVYPPAPELAECFGWVDPVVIVRADLQPPDVALVVTRTADGWRVVQTIGW